MERRSLKNPQTVQAKQTGADRLSADRLSADRITANRAQKQAALINLSQVKAFFKARGLRVSPKALTALDEEVQKICLRAGDKVLVDRRKTVKKLHI